MNEIAHAFDSLRDAANRQTAFRLLRAACFELTLGRELVWLQSNMAELLLRCDVPRSFLQFTQIFTDITPRLSVASLQALLPGAQSRWSAAIKTENNPARYYDILIERYADNASGEACFAGYVRDVTADHLAAIQNTSRQKADADLGCKTSAAFDAETKLLTQLAVNYCPDAALLSFNLQGVDSLYTHYGLMGLDHIYHDLLRRLIAFLPQTASVSRGDGQMQCLVADIASVDIDQLSRALTSFPVTTPQGPVSLKLDVDVKRLKMSAADKAATQFITPKRSEPPEISEGDIIGLLNQRSLSLALQPICAARSGILHHYEALLRIDDPVKGPQSAWRHILAAEDYGLIHLLDHRALERAMLLMIRYPDINLALNISAGTVGDIERQDAYLEQLDAFPALHSRLTIEMTETMALAQPALAAQFAERLRERGCDLSIDDFGAGHTSFKTLMSTEAAQIKLDGSLIDGICQSVSQQNFVRLMVDFAKTFDVSLIAERVETAEERLLLAGLGVDYLQGYYLGKPISEHDFTGRAAQIAFK